MMEKLFSSILEIGLTTGVFILLVAALRGLFRRASHRVFVLLWLVAGLRLLIPVNIESPVSVRGLAEQWQTEQAGKVTAPADVERPAGETRPSANLNVQANTHPVQAKDDGEAAGNPPEVQQAEIIDFSGGILAGMREGTGIAATRIASVIWLCGAALILIYGAVRYVRLRLRLRDAVRMGGNVWQSDRIDTPFVFGVLRPRIYVPFGIAEKLPYVLVHERTHLKHGDHIIKALWFAVLALYWFHPLVWLAYGLLGRDMELACDERVIVGLDDQEKGGYARALLELSMGKKPLVLSPLAFGEVGVKMRIIHMLSYKKPAVFAALVCLVVGVVFAAVLLTDPKSSNAQPGSGNEGALGAGYGNSQDKEASGDKTPENMGDSNAQGDASIGGSTVALGDKTVGTLNFGVPQLIDLDGDGRAEQVFATLAADGYLAIKLTDASGEEETGVFIVDGYDEVVEDKLDAGEVDIDHAVSLWDGYVMSPKGDYFYLLDVDKSDGFLELAFLEYGPSDDWETRLVRFADGKLQYIGSFTDSPEGPNTVIAGDGTIKAPTRFDLIQTSFVMGEWSMTAEGKLIGGAPGKGEFLYAEEQYQSELPVTAARDFTARLQDGVSSACASVPRGTKLCICGFRGIGALPEDNTAFMGSYAIYFYYYDADGSRVEAEVYLESPFGQVNCVGESFESPMELFDGLSMAG